MTSVEERRSGDRDADGETPEPSGPRPSRGRPVRDYRRRTVAWALYAMARPSQLALIWLVYTLGAVAAVARTGAWSAPAYLAGLLALLPVAASVHYANEYADYWTDLLTERTPFSGGSGALARTGLPRRLPLSAAGVALVAGAGLWAPGAAAGWLPASATVLLAAVAVLGWQYSLPPLSLAWRGLGEVDNAAVGGLLLPAYGYAAHAGRLPLGAALAFLPFAAVVFVNLLETQWPDRHADAAVGKRTLPTRWSPARLRTTYVLGVAAALGSPVVLAGGPLPVPVALASAPAAPLLVWGAARYTRVREPFPAVAAMVLVAAAQTVAWGYLALWPA